MTALAFCGAVAGFMLPTIASSLVQQVKHEPAVRLLPVPRTPASATLPPSPATPAEQSTAPVTRLTTKQLERKYPLPRRPSLSGTLVKPQQPAVSRQEALAPTTTPAPKPATKQAPTKPTVSGTGGAAAPSGK